jgi:CRISPR-associated endonuclease Cas2
LGNDVTGRAVLVVYDVFDDERRDALRRKLTPLADRVQQSGWLIPAGNRVNVKQLGAALTAGLNPTDRARLYSPCANCASDTIWLPDNQPHRLDPGDLWM